MITHFRATLLQRRKLNKQAMLSVTRWPSSSSRSCLSSTIDCTTDILDLNGSRKKKLLTIAFAGHVKVPWRGGLQKGNKWFPEAASSFPKKKIHLIQMLVWHFDRSELKGVSWWEEKVERNSSWFVYNLHAALHLIIKNKWKIKMYNPVVHLVVLPWRKNDHRLLSEGVSI